MSLFDKLLSAVDEGSKTGEGMMMQGLQEYNANMRTKADIEFRNLVNEINISMEEGFYAPPEIALKHNPRYKEIYENGFNGQKGINGIRAYITHKIPDPYNLTTVNVGTAREIVGNKGYSWYLQMQQKNQDSSQMASKFILDNNPYQLGENDWKERKAAFNEQLNKQRGQVDKKEYNTLYGSFLYNQNRDVQGSDKQAEAWNNVALGAYNPDKFKIDERSIIDLSTTEKKKYRAGYFALIKMGYTPQQAEQLAQPEVLLSEISRLANSGPEGAGKASAIANDIKTNYVYELKRGEELQILLDTPTKYKSKFEYLVSNVLNYANQGVNIMAGRKVFGEEKESETRAKSLVKAGSEINPSAVIQNTSEARSLNKEKGANYSTINTPLEDTLNLINKEVDMVMKAGGFVGGKITSTGYKGVKFDERAYHYVRDSKGNDYTIIGNALRSLTPEELKQGAVLSDERIKALAVMYKDTNMITDDLFKRGIIGHPTPTQFQKNDSIGSEFINPYINTNDVNNTSINDSFK